MSLSNLVAQSPSATAPRSGTYYLTQYVPVTTKDGVYGLEIGTQVTLVGQNRAKTGDLEFDVKSDQVTNDFKIAMQAWEAYRARQEQLAAEGAAAIAVQRQEQQRQIAQAIEQKQRQEAAVPPAPNKPFFDDPNYKSAFDRDRDRAQKSEQEQYQRANEQRLAEIEARTARKARTRGTQAKSDAKWHADKTQSRIDDLERQVNKVRSDETYEYNKAATERGSRATYDVEEAADRKMQDLNRQINDARHEQTNSDNQPQ